MSTKSVAEKLLIKPNTAIWLSDPSHRGLVEPLPDGVRPVTEMAEATTAVLITSDAASLRAMLPAHRDQLSNPATLWVAYPKANRSDINRDTLWPILGEYGMRPIAQVAVDEVWSALRFRPIREEEAPFTGGR